jgi:SAM-dependent methyltransferase
MNPAEFDNIARAERDFWWFRGMRDILFAMLDPLARAQSIQQVLEAGCGTGYMSKVLAARYGWRMTPLDLGWQGLAYAREYGLQRLVQGDIAALPFPDDRFDAVVSLDVIVHFPLGQEDRAMAELSRVLRPGGLLILRASALNILRSRHSQFALERQRFTKKRLVALARRHGIRILRVTYANSLLMPVALIKFRIWEPLTRQPPRSGVQPASPWLEHLLYAPLKMEAGCLRRGFDFPLGQSLILLGQKET